MVNKNWGKCIGCESVQEPCETLLLEDSGGILSVGCIAYAFKYGLSIIGNAEDLMKGYLEDDDGEE